MHQIQVIIAIGVWIHNNWAGILVILGALYGLLAAIVKIFPNLDEGWLLTLIKILGKITNRTIDDEALRAQRKLQIKQ
jgi:hypothetical protein